MSNNLKFTISWFLILVIIGLGFYWFEYRPFKTRKECYNYTKEKYQDKERFTTDNYDNSLFSYKVCLYKYGLKE